MSRFSQRDYETAAQVIRERWEAARAEPDPDGVPVVEQFAMSFAKVYAEDNPKFDRRRFYLAALGSIDLHMQQLQEEEA